MRGLIFRFCAIAGITAAGISTCGFAADDPVESEMLVVGEAEYMFITEAGWAYDARIDTGAATCSIHAVDVEPFERDGEQWVSYKLINPESGKAAELESRVERVVKIKGRGGDASQERYVVKLEATLGQRTMRLEFNLTDRGDFEYPLLVGRNLLRGVALVDVARAYVQGKRPRPPKR